MKALAGGMTVLPSESALFHVSGFDENIESQGELILQESFQVWDPKTLIRKGRERHLFLFEMSLVFSKEVKDSSGRSKYLYKSKLFVSISTQSSSPQNAATALLLERNSCLSTQSSSLQNAAAGEKSPACCLSFPPKLLRNANLNCDVLPSAKFFASESTRGHADILGAWRFRP